MNTATTTLTDAAPLKWNRSTATASGRAIRSSTCGRYTITKLPSGDYRLEAALPLQIPRWMRTTGGLAEAKHMADLHNNPNFGD